THRAFQVGGIQCPDAAAFQPARPVDPEVVDALRQNMQVLARNLDLIKVHGNHHCPSWNVSPWNGFRLILSMITPSLSFITPSLSIITPSLARSPHYTHRNAFSARFPCPVSSTKPPAASRST